MRTERFKCNGRRSWHAYGVYAARVGAVLRDAGRADLGSKAAQSMPKYVGTS
jgi:hypothetical protein